MVLLVHANDGNGSQPVIVAAIPINASLEQAEQRLDLRKFRSANFDTTEKGIYYDVPLPEGLLPSGQKLFSLQLCPVLKSVINSRDDLPFCINLYKNGATT